MKPGTQISYPRIPRIALSFLVGLLMMTNLAFGKTGDEPVTPETQEMSDGPENVADESRETPPETAQPTPAIDEAALLPLLLDLSQGKPKKQVAALRKAQELRHPFLLPHIRYLARIGPPEIRILACETLALYRNVEGLHEIILSAQDPHEALAIRATELMAQFPLPIIRQELARIAQSSVYSEARRQAALTSLQTMGTPEAQAILNQLSKELPEQLSVATTLATGKAQRTEPTRLLLLRRLFTTEHLPGRLDALEQVTETFPSATALDLIRTCLKDPDPSLRREAFKAARGLDTPELRAFLSETLPTLEPVVQPTWLTLVKQLPAEDSAPLLIQAIQPNHGARFREVALQALSRTDELATDASATNAIITLFQNAATDPQRVELARALSVRPDQRSFDALTQSLGQVQFDESIRLMAFEMLLNRSPQNLVEQLVQLAENEPSLDIRKQAAAELVLNHCETLGERCYEFDYHYPSDTAAALFYISAGTMGASSLGLLSNVAGGNQPVIAALSGAVLGSGTAYILAPEEGVTLPEAFHFTSMGIWGSALGYGLGATLVDGLEKPEFTWTFLGGQLLGTTLGALSYRDTAHTAGDFALMHWSGVEATAMALGALSLWGNESPTEYQEQMAPAVATLVGLGAGVLPMWFLADDLTFEGTDTAMITLGTLGSGVLGGLAAYGTSDREGASIGGFLLGQGVGYMGSIVASQYADLNRGELAWISMGTTMGSVLGGGIGYHTSQDHAPAAALGAFVGGLGLTALHAFTVEHFDLTPNAIDLALYSTLVGTTLGGSVALISDTDFLPNAMIGGSTGFLAGLVYDHLKPMKVRDTTLAASAALAGATVGTSLAFMLPDEPSAATAGALIGAGTAIGYGTMLWAAPKLQFKNGDTLAILGSVAIGSFVGGSLPGLIYGTEEEFLQTAGGVGLGAALGYGAGLAISQFSDQDSSDITETLFMTSMGGLFGQGLTAFTGEGATRANRTLTLAGTGLGLSAGLYFSDATSYQPEDYWLISYLSAFGAFNGAFVPGLWLRATDDVNFDSQAVGASLIGTTLGATSGIMLSQYEHFTFADVNEMALGSIAASVFGAGIGLMVPVDETGDMRPWVAGMQTAGILGTAAVGLLAPHTDFTAGDTTLGFLATAYGAWQGAGASLLLDGTDRQVMGAVLATTALGAAGGAAISQYVDATTEELFAAFSGSVWGAWVGGMGSVALKTDFGVDLSNKELLGSFFIASDLGLIATALAMSPVLEMKPERVAWINLYGLSGMALGSALGAVFPSVPFWTSNVSGSALGLVLGVVMTGLVDMPSIGETETPQNVTPETETTSRASHFRYPGHVTAILPQFQITPITNPNGQVVAPGNRFLLGFMGLWD